jgi:hypothetical protein
LIYLPLERVTLAITTTAALCFSGLELYNSVYGSCPVAHGFRYATALLATFVQTTFFWSVDNLQEIRKSNPLFGVFVLMTHNLMWYIIDIIDFVRPLQAFGEQYYGNHEIIISALLVLQMQYRLEAFFRWETLFSNKRAPVYRSPGQQNFGGTLLALILALSMIVLALLGPLLDVRSDNYVKLMVLLLTSAHVVVLPIFIWITVYAIKKNKFKYEAAPKHGAFQTSLLFVCAVALLVWCSAEIIRGSESEHYWLVAGNVTTMIEVALEVWLLSYVNCTGPFRYELIIVTLVKIVS